MRLIAIARLRNNGKLVGFRLLDKDTRVVKDIKLESLIDAIENMTIIVENLLLKDGKIEGNMGSLGGMTIIDDGEVYTSPSLILIDRNKDYVTVTDYTGVIRQMCIEEAVKYMGKYGGANCRFAIFKGKYSIAYRNDKVENRVTKLKTIKNTKYYLGDRLDVNGVERIIVGNSNYNRYPDNSNNKGLFSKAFKYKDGTLYEFNLPAIRGCYLGKECASVCNENYMVVNCNYYINNSDITSDLIRNISIEYEALNIINKKKNKDAWVKLNVNNPENRSEQEIKEIMHSIKKNNINLVVMVVKGESKDIVLAREYGNKGISYQVYTNKYGIKSVSIESIFEDADKYINIDRLNDIELVIRGLDGTYKYNLEKINKDYKNELVESDRALRTKLKAKLINSVYKEDINTKGELIRIENDGGNRLVIPDNVEVLLKNSIKLSKNIKEIIIGEKVKRSYAKPIDYRYERLSLESIIIRNKACMVNVLNDIQCLIEHRLIENAVNIKIESRKVTYKEYAVSIVSKDKIHIDGDTSDVDLVKVYKYLIGNRRKYGIYDTNKIIQMTMQDVNIGRLNKEEYREIIKEVNNKQ